MKLNNIVKLTAASLFSLSLVSCGNDFLTFDPYGVDGSVNFWSSEEDLISAVDAFGAFTYKEGVTGRGIMWYENCSDNLVTGRPQAEADQIKGFTMSASNGRDVKDTWPAMYQLIAKANSVLLNAPLMNISKSVKEYGLGQAYFYRGFAYLWLAPYYGDHNINGGIPIVTEKTPTAEIDQPRPASVLANYDLIISDMRAAGEYLDAFSEQNSSDYGRPHKAAAWAFAARAALYAAQYDNSYYDIVIEMCDKVMNMTGADKRSLYSDYTKLFREENNFGCEYIFSLLGNKDEGPKFHGMSFQNSGWGYYNTWGYFQPTLELYEAYQEGDTRRDATILYPGDHITFVGRDIHFGVNPSAIASTSGMTFRKFMSPWEPSNCAGTTVNSNANNASNRLGTVLMRYADVVLMKAEALIWKNGEGDATAKALLNSIRSRAGLPQDSNATKEELKRERRCELAFEFMPSRHLDLVRWGDAKEVYSKPLHGVSSTYDAVNGLVVTKDVEIFAARDFDPETKHVFPIPSAEIESSVNLVQNKSY